VHLAKPCIDIGLNTANAKSMLTFWSNEVGLVYEGALTVRRGVTQHRFDCDGSIIKVNAHAAGVAAEPRSGYRELIVAKSEIAAPTGIHDPDRNTVCLWPTAIKESFRPACGTSAATARRRTTPTLRDCRCDGRDSIRIHRRFRCPARAVSACAR